MLPTATLTRYANEVPTQSRLARRFHVALAAGLGAYLAAVAAIVAWTIRTTGGVTYALDDAYIHMAISRSLAFFGVWGPTPYEYASASSSPSWTVLLALLDRVGITLLAPLMLNVVFALGAIALAWLTLREAGCGPVQTGVALVAFSFLAPLPLMAIVGMEFSLYAFVLVGLLRAASRTLAGIRMAWWVLPAWAFAAGATRYETALFVGPLCLVLLARRAWKPAFVVGAAAAVVPLLYGIVSMMNGWGFVPASISMKSQVPGVGIDGLAGFVSYNLGKLHAVPELFLLLGLAAALYAFQPREESASARGWFLLLALVGGALFAALGTYGWAYRYESAFIAVLALGIAMNVPARWIHGVRGMPLKRGAVLMLAAGLLLSPLAGREVGAMKVAQTFPSNDRYLHMEAADFVKQLPKDTVVGLTDLGVITYFGEHKIVDLWGLGSHSVERARHAGHYSAADMQRIIDENHIGVIVMNGESMPGIELPADWVKVASWTNPHTGAGPFVIWASSASQAGAVQSQWSGFAPQLPAGTPVKIGA